MNESHCMEPDVNTPEFSPKQIIALIFNVQAGGISLSMLYYQLSLDYCFSYLTSNELYNS